MDVINNIRSIAEDNGDKIAIVNPNSNYKTVTYRELYTKAYILSEYINSKIDDDNPIIVYGHKSPFMIISFIACVMSGHAYCPIDSMLPMERYEIIKELTKSGIIIETEAGALKGSNVLKASEIERICSKRLDDILQIPDTCLKGDQTYYIIFTSGSTGVPKGVEITYDDLNRFLEWSITLGEEIPYNNDTVFLNQAPFSFDLSVMDLYTSLACGATLCLMDKIIQSDFTKLTPFMEENAITAIVATPSFIKMCLADKLFNAASLPLLHNFFFCGEILTNKTAAKLLQRFPEAVIQNTYGPTESTVAISSVRITQELLERYETLPVGAPKPGTDLRISQENSFKKNGFMVGEVLIIGDTLAKGYYKREDLTKKAFIKITPKDIGEVTAYRTGDLGYIKDGMLFYEGRIDLQIKLNGFRIEIGDIESNILKEDFVDGCAVVPRWIEGRVKGLTGVIVLGNTQYDLERARLMIIRDLSSKIPEYMIPKDYLFVDTLPMTSNGKLDRKKLEYIVEEM